MNRYLLDTNIVLFLLLSELENITKENKAILDDYNNQIYTSSISIMEIVQLVNIGKIKSKKYKTSFSMIEAIEKEYFIKILPFAKPHTETLSKLKIADGHNDPFDHSIIAHAMTEKINLVSSDRKFNEYTSQKLLFCYNKR